MENEKELEAKLRGVMDTVFEMNVNLDDIETALDQITDFYGSAQSVSMDDLNDFMHGNSSNGKGKDSFNYFTGYKNIMWLARTARMYCEEAKKLSESVLE